MRTKTSALGLSAKPTKTPWFLRFAPTVKGIVSLVENLLPSLTQKEASTAAAVLAGIDLLAAPMEQQAQAQSDLPEVILWDWDIMTSGEFDIEVVHSGGSGTAWVWPKYCWSGGYKKVPRSWGPSVRWINAEDYDYFDGIDDGVHSNDPSHKDEYYHPAFRYDYYICKIVAKNPATGEMDKSFGWVEVWFYTGEYYTNGEYIPPSAYVYDSEGNFYEVDLTLE